MVPMRRADVSRASPLAGGRTVHGPAGRYHPQAAGAPRLAGRRRTLDCAHAQPPDREGRPTRGALPSAARAPAARRPDAPTKPRGVRGPGAPRRRARAAATLGGSRPPVVDPAVGPARNGQDVTRAAARGGGRGGVPDALGGDVGRRRGALDDRGVAGTSRPQRHPLGAVHRRDPPLQQGAAGRAAAPRRGRHGHAHRRDDREPLLRGELGAPLAAPRVAVGGPDRRRRGIHRPARPGGPGAGTGGRAGTRGRGDARRRRVRASGRGRGR